MQETKRQDGDSLAFYGSGVLPDGTAAMNRSPVINYTYARTRPIIERMLLAGNIDTRHGARVRYANPITGGRCCRRWAPRSPCCRKGFAASPVARPMARSSSAPRAPARRRWTVRCSQWGPNDVFVVPPWKRYAHSAAKQSVLFSISDRPAQEALGIWREGK